MKWPAVIVFAFLVLGLLGAAPVSVSRNDFDALDARFRRLDKELKALQLDFQHVQKELEATQSRLQKVETHLGTLEGRLPTTGASDPTVDSRQTIPKPLEEKKGLQLEITDEKRKDCSYSQAAN